MALTQAHTIYIRCRAPELWAALTEGQTTRHYFYESLIESSFEPGAVLRYVVEPDRDVEDQTPIPTVVGEIESVERERSLVYTFRFVDLDEPPTRVRWTLTAHASPGIMRVDVSHDGFAAQTEGWQRVDEGWPVILSGLKTWLETGEPLNLVGAPPPEPE